VASAKGFHSIRPLHCQVRALCCWCAPNHVVTVKDARVALCCVLLCFVSAASHWGVFLTKGCNTISAGGLRCYNWVLPGRCQHQSRGVLLNLVLRR
jgi:hypothetical protein